MNNFIPVPIGKKILGITQYAEESRARDGFDYSPYVGYTFEASEYDGGNGFCLRTPDGKEKTGWFYNSYLQGFIYAKKKTIVIVKK